MHHLTHGVGLEPFLPADRAGRRRIAEGGLQADAEHDPLVADAGHLPERLLVRTGIHEALLEFLEGRSQGEKISRIVLHQEDACLRLGRQAPRKAQGLR